MRVNQDGQARDLFQLLAYPEATLERLAEIWPDIGAWEPEVAEQIEIEAAYSGYLDRQTAEITAFRRDENLTEERVNDRLVVLHDDVAMLRRYLVDEGFLDRDHGVYWRTGGTVVL